MGVVLLAGSSGIWLIPTVALWSINGRINSWGLRGSPTEPEQKMLIDLRWSRTWWETMEATILNPTSIILSIIGMLLIVCALIARFA
jgi:hypothetical protein